jgi:tetratricopeptide (TPR) repeat protein
MAGLVLVGLALRLLVVAEQHDDILFENPTVDADFYVQEGRSLASGAQSEPKSYWQPPGLVYVLAGISRVAGSGLLWPRLVGCVVSALCIALAFALARRFFSRSVALAAAAVVAVHGVLIHAAAELLPGTWIAASNLFALVLLVRAAQRGRWLWAVGAGLAFGIAIVFSPLIVPFIPLAGLWFWRQAPPRRLPLLLVMTLLAALPAAGVTARNYRVSGEPDFVSTNGGLNFYVGNNASYYDAVNLRPGEHWTDLIEQAYQNGAATRGQMSRYFYQQGWHFVREQPATALARFARKLYLFWNGAEIPRSTDIYADRSQSRVLAALVWPGVLRFPDGLVLPLALLGLAVSWRRNPSARLLVAYVATQTITVAFFFVTSRYRIPALLVLAPLAVVGAMWLVARLRAPGWLARGSTAAIALGLVVVLNLPTRETAISLAAETEYHRGLVYRVRKQDFQRAAEHLAAAAKIDPGDARIWFEMGTVAEEAGRPDAAIAAWELAANVDPSDRRPRRRIAQVEVQRGNLEAAASALRANLAPGLRQPASYAADYLSLATIDVTLGRTTSSLAALKQAASLDPNSWRNQAPDYLRLVLSSPIIGGREFWRDLGELLEDTGLPALAATVRDRGAASTASVSPATPPGKP